MIELKNISVHFEQKGKDIPAVNEVNLSVAQGDVYGIVGYSGAGKSTLVRVMNFLQKPTKGEVIIQQTNLGDLTPKELRKERKTIGMIFQHFNLMESRTIF
ncbi:MAG TPA: methionine ABC transporter ATP-binding protein, partial [Enterococcus sp.]|nr:methionine ABC transporter ATP-binding protein [Enterococcus sp.]